MMWMIWAPMNESKVMTNIIHYFCWWVVSNQLLFQSLMCNHFVFKTLHGQALGSISELLNPFHLQTPQTCWAVISLKVKKWFLKVYFHLFAPNWGNWYFLKPVFRKHLLSYLNSYIILFMSCFITSVLFLCNCNYHLHNLIFSCL